MEYDYSNKNDFTQKDLMIHLLQSAQHSATREELQEVKSELKIDTQELRNDIQELRSELKGDIQELRSELKGDIQELRSELKGDIQDLRSELKGDMQEVKDDIKSLELQLRETNNKFNKLGWLMLGSAITIFFKEKILAFIF